MATALHVNGHDLPIDGQVLHVAPGWQTVYVLMATPGPAADAKSIERAAHTVLVSREPLFDGGRVVESFVMPATQNFFGRVVPGGAWIAGLRFDDADWPKVAAQFDDDGDAQNIAQKGGGDSMNVRDKTFSDAVRGPQPPKPETIDAEQVRVVREVIAEALRPLLLQLQELDSRIRRVVSGIQPERDVFGVTVRTGKPTVAEELAREKARVLDPFGSAVREKREPLTFGQGHRFFRDRKHR